MQFIKFIITGVLFGIIMTKSEAVSWFRIQEMFRFQAFHMYGIIGTAVTLGALIVWAIKRYDIQSFSGKSIVFADKAANYKAGLIGGSLFGLGWALTGACPGPLYTLLGHGYMMYLIPIAAAILGTFCYGMLRDRLPH